MVIPTDGGAPPAESNVVENPAPPAKTPAGDTSSRVPDFSDFDTIMAPVIVAGQPGEEDDKGTPDPDKTPNKDDAAAAAAAAAAKKPDAEETAAGAKEGTAKEGEEKEKPAEGAKPEEKKELTELEKAAEKAKGQEERRSDFNAVKTELEELKLKYTAEEAAKNDALAAVETSNKILARYGGVDGFNNLAEEFVDLVTDPTKPFDAAKAVLNLPHGGAIRSEVMFDSIGVSGDGTMREMSPEWREVAEENQLTLFNMGLRAWHDLPAPITLPEFGKIGEYLAWQLGENRETFMKHIDEQLNLYDDPAKRENRRLTLENEELKKGKASGQEEPGKGAAPAEGAGNLSPDVQNGLRVMKEFAEIEAEASVTIDADLGKKYLGITDKDPLAVSKNALLYVVKAAAAADVKALKDGQPRPAFANALEFLKRSTGKHPTFIGKKADYQTAFSAQALELLRPILPLLAAVKTNTPAPVEDKDKNGDQGKEKPIDEQKGSNFAAKKPDGEKIPSFASYDEEMAKVK